MNETPQQQSAVARPALTPEESVFSGGQALVEAFTDPSKVPAPAVLELIELAVANRPDAAALREALMVRFAKARGISDYGISVQDAFMTEPGSPSKNPKTLYVSPHPRPTAGSVVMTAYTDPAGEIHVLLARNWKDPNDHTKGPREHWHFPGGHLEAREPGDTSGRGFDANLDATAKRELQEETGLTFDELGVTPKQLFVRSDSGAQTNKPSQSIDAFYLADIGRRNEAPPVRIGDDVGQLAWVRLRDIVRASPDPLLFSGTQAQYQITINGKTEPFKPEHVELLERGTQALREKLFPLHEAGNCSCCKEHAPLQPEAHAHHDKLAVAHGYKPISITIELGGQGWQQKIAERQMAAQAAQPTIH